MHRKRSPRIFKSSISNRQLIYAPSSLFDNLRLSLHLFYNVMNNAFKLCVYANYITYEISGKTQDILNVTQNLKGNAHRS